MENTYKPATAIEEREFAACGKRTTEDLAALVNQLEWVGTTKDGAKSEFVEYLIRELTRLKKDVDNRRSFLLTKPRRNQERDRLRDRRHANATRMIELLREANTLKDEIDADSRLISELNDEEHELATGYKRHRDE